MRKRRRSARTKLDLLKFPPKQEDPWLTAPPIEYLEDLVKEIKAGAPLRGVLIFFLDDKGKPHIWRRGVAIPEQIAFGQLITEMALKEWRKEE